jgi:outer membrane protein assembly factor BamB
VTASGITTTAPGYYLPHTTDQLYLTNPVIGGGHVFVEPVFVKAFSNAPAGFAELVAVDEPTGRVDWTRRLGPEVDISLLPAPVVDHGRVYAGDLSTLYAFNASDGALLWKYSSPATGQPIFPNVSGGRVYFARNFGLFALNASTGAVDWTARLLATPTDSTPPAVMGPTVVIGDCYGGVQAFSTSDGAPRWAVHLSSPTLLANVTSPTFGGGNIFVSNGKRLFALDANKGTIVWSHPEQDVLGNPVFVTDQGSVFAPTTAGPWQAYSTATGQERPGFRSDATGADVGQAATGSRDVIFFPTVLGALKAIDASTGRTLWTMSGSTVPPAIAGIEDKTSSAAVAGSALVVFVGRSTGAFLALYGLP